MKNFSQHLKDALQVIAKYSVKRPKVAIVLGSGLGPLADRLDQAISIPYQEIPHFKATSVVGHSGRLVFGQLKGVEVVAMQGRLHPYEGYDIEDVVFPIRLLCSLGIEALILTNAAGGINTLYKGGDLVAIADHLNLSGRSPLVGKNDDHLGPRFPDMSDTYNKSLREKLLITMKELNLPQHEGIYAGVLGPTYETPAEVRMLKILGGDMVGMSTISESIAAHHMGTPVVGISCISNMAAGIEKGELKHEDIKHQAEKVMEKFISLIENFIKKV